MEWKDDPWNGSLCRALGSAIAISPPLIISPEQIETIGKIIAKALDTVADDLGVL